MPKRKIVPITSFHKKIINFVDKKQNCDVKIRVQDKTFNCHRVVLASESEYFDAMFGGRFMDSMGLLFSGGKGETSSGLSWNGRFW